MKLGKWLGVALGLSLGAWLDRDEGDDVGLKLPTPSKVNPEFLMIAPKEVSKGCLYQVLWMSPWFTSLTVTPKTMVSVCWSLLLSLCAVRL